MFSVGLCLWMERKFFTWIDRSTTVERVHHSPPWMMYVDRWFFLTNFHLDRMLYFAFFCVMEVIKIAARKVFPRWFVLDGLIVKTSIVQSNFLSHVQCSRTSIKVVQYHWMIAPAKDPEISFLFFSQLTSLKFFHSSRAPFPVLSSLNRYYSISECACMIKKTYGIQGTSPGHLSQLIGSSIFFKDPQGPQPRSHVISPNCLSLLSRSLGTGRKELWERGCKGCGTGDTAIYGLYRYVQLWRVWFSCCSDPG